MGSSALVDRGSADCARLRNYDVCGGNNFVVVTHDLDFSAILAVTHGKKPSVIQIRSEDVSAEFIGKQTVAALRHMLAELEAGALLTIEVGRTRLRLLPIQTEDEP